MAEKSKEAQVLVQRHPRTNLHRNPKKTGIDMTKTALVVGATGIVGSAMTDLLLREGWRVAAMSRTPRARDGVVPIAADLHNAASVRDAVADLLPELVVFATWARQATEAENIRVNSAMVRHVLDAVGPQKSVRHVALVTGTKHYLGPFEAYGKGNLPPTPFHEAQPRLDIDNFYYAQEDEVFAAAARDGFTWSVHRPHTIIGMAVGNAMNMGTTLAVYATICRETGRPFHFPGAETAWNGLLDMTDAGILAEQILWAAQTPAAANTAFNTTNGDVFRWSWLWPRIAAFFNVPAEGFDGTVRPLEQQMADDASVWRDIAARYDLAEPDLSRLASPWHTDADLTRPIEVINDMSNSRRLGFSAFIPTDDAMFALFERLRAARLIP